jgi:hypothetical protein
MVPLLPISGTHHSFPNGDDTGGPPLPVVDANRISE